MADRGREEVYAAELAAYDGTDLEAVVGFDELVALTERLTAASWWPRGPVVLRRARRDASSSSTRRSPSRDDLVVRLADPQRTRATLVHELAHVLAGVEAGHGPVFRRAHVDLAVAAFGTERGGWLADAYAASGLAVGERSWPAPPGRSGAIAL